MMSYNKEVRNSRNVILRSNYSKHFFDVKKFEALYRPKPSYGENNFSYRLGAPYFGRPSHILDCTTDPDLRRFILK